jgi:hypothetical protein
VDCGNVKVLVGIDECDLSLQGLFDLVEADFCDGQCVFDGVVERLAGGCLVEPYDLWVCALNDGQHVR